MTSGIPREHWYFRRRGSVQPRAGAAGLLGFAVGQLVLISIIVYALSLWF